MRCSPRNAVPPESGNLLLLRSIADAWLPTYPQLDEDLQRSVTRDTAGFLDRRIGGMPPFLSLPVRITLRFLDLESWASHRAGFRKAPREWRTHRLDGWGRSRFPAKAGVSRLLRSLILLYFYDHPDVRRILSGTEGPAE